MPKDGRSRGRSLSHLAVKENVAASTQNPYSGAVQASAIYGDLLRAAFDLHRFDLYQALHWPLPDRWQEEKPAPPGQSLTRGQALSQFLHRGQGIADVLYAHAKEDKKPEESEEETKS